MAENVESLANKLDHTVQCDLLLGGGWVVILWIEIGSLLEFYKYVVIKVLVLFVQK